MKKYLYFPLIFLICLSFLNCNNEKVPVDDIPVIKPQNDSTFVQYGTPFTNVCERQDAAIYQVNIRVFSQDGNLLGVIDRLDSIKALGINVVYLMPVYPVGQLNGVNSPYCIKDYKAVNPEFGNLADLRRLVDGAHSRNMSVILDWVGNHTAWDNSWITSHKDWYLQDESENIVSPPGRGWNDVAQLNFENAAMRIAMIRAMKYWVYTANIDGFRCDFVDGPPIDFWEQAIDTLRNISTHKLLLLAEGSKSAYYTAGFDYNFGFAFYYNLKDVFSKNYSVKSIETVNASEYSGSGNGQQVVRYLTNHDVNGAEGTPLELFGGIDGSMAAFVLVAYVKGVPMIYNGQEVGNSTRLTFPFTSRKIDWLGEPAITAEYKKVLAIRNNSNAIKRGQLTSYSKNDVYAFTKEYEGEKVFILSNIRNKAVTFILPAIIANTTWNNLLDGGNITLTTEITLQPYEYFVFGNL